MAPAEPAPFRAACVQLRSGTDVPANIDATSCLIRDAADAGAALVFTPEVTSLMEVRTKALFAKIVAEDDDPALAAFRQLAAELGIWLNIGSIPLKVAADKVANRSFLIDPAGAVTARYDKIHMFDVDLPGGESYRESKNYRAGETSVVTPTPWGPLGLTICYDLRFPALYRSLAQAGASYLTAPSAFTRQTGAAHWHVLVRARAIETGCYLFAAAQGGNHACGRETYGHSLIVSPWGEVVAEKPDEEPGIILADIDPGAVAAARARVPSLSHDRSFRPG